MSEPFPPEEFEDRRIRVRAAMQTQGIDALLISTPIAAGMVFHLMPWLLRSDHGDSFLSDTVIVTDEGCEMVTQTPRGLLVRT